MLIILHDHPVCSLRFRFQPCSLSHLLVTHITSIPGHWQQILLSTHLQSCCKSIFPQVSPPTLLSPKLSLISHPCIVNGLCRHEGKIWVEERSKWWKVTRGRLIVRGELKPGCTRKGVILSIPRESKQVNRLSGKASRIAPSGLFSHLWKIHIMKQVYIWITFCTKICSPFHSICHKSLKCLVQNFSGIPGMHGFQNFCTILNLIPFSLPVWNIYPVYIHISIFWSV